MISKSAQEESVNFSIQLTANDTFDAIVSIHFQLLVFKIHTSKKQYADYKRDGRFYARQQLHFLFGKMSTPSPSLLRAKDFNKRYIV